MRGYRHLLGSILAFAFVFPGMRARAAEESLTYAAAVAKLSTMEGKTAPDLTLLFQDGNTETLADHHGRWVFLEIGSTGYAPSEQVARSLSRIADQLHGEPFDFIEVYRDPGWDDIALGAHTEIEGIPARPGPEGIPADDDIGYYPACFLIDPRGVVVWTGSFLGEEALRAALKEKIGSKFNFPADFATVDPYRAQQEKAYQLTASGDPIDLAKAEPLWQQLVAEQPDDRLNLTALASLLHTGKKDWSSFLDPQIAAAGDDTPLHWHLLAVKADYTAYDNKMEAAVPLYQELLKKYPGSFRVRRDLLALNRPVDDYSDDDLALMHDAFWTDTDTFAMAAAAYAFESKNRIKEAAGFFAQLRGASLIAFLGRQGHADKALALLEKSDGESPPDPKTVNRATAFNQVREHLALGDWRGALPYAARHLELTPQNAMGPVAQLLCAVRLHDTEGVQTALDTLAAFKTDRPAYLFAQQVQSGAASVTPESIAPLANDPYRNIGLFWAAAVFEAQGKTDDAIHAYTLALNGAGSAWYLDFIFLYSLRAGLEPASPRVDS